jgi:hypothetical protein
VKGGEREEGVLELKFRALSARSHGGRMCEVSDTGNVIFG